MLRGRLNQFYRESADMSWDILKSRDAGAWRCTCAKRKEMNQKQQGVARRAGRGSRRVWLGSWVLGNSRRPPNELFSSLPIYFCSLFNQPPLVTLLLRHSGETPKVLFLRCSSGESTLQRGLSPRTAWINGRRERRGEDLYVVNIHKISDIYSSDWLEIVTRRISTTSQTTI